jgi:hypothetical protein
VGKSSSRQWAQFSGKNKHLAREKAFFSQNEQYSHMAQLLLAEPAILSQSLTFPERRNLFAARTTAVCQRLLTSNF